MRGTPRQLLVHDCSSLPGNSGSPIFTTVWRDGRASLQVVAMHSTASVSTRILPFRGEDGSVATSMADVVPMIRAHSARPFGAGTRRRHRDTHPHPLTSFSWRRAPASAKHPP